VGEGGIVAEDVHPLPLREDHADRTVLEDQAGFALQKDTHLLMEQSLDKTYARLT